MLHGQRGSAERLLTAPVRLRCVSWNVDQLSGSHYSAAELVPLLLGPEPAGLELVAIGLQEVEMTVGSFMSAAKSYKPSEKGRRWKESLTRALEPEGFVLLDACQVMGLLSAVFARDAVARRIRCVFHCFDEFCEFIVIFEFFPAATRRSATRQSAAA